MQALGVGLSERNEMTDCPELGGFAVQEHEIDLDAAFTGLTPLTDGPVTGYDPSPDWVMLRLHGGAAENDGYDYYGHASDAVYNEMSVREMLGKLSVLVADPES
jgi:hypothetical protein